MKLVTRQGEFDTFAELRAAYINSDVDAALDPKHLGAEWDEGKLHASEVGMCPRMQVLRLKGAPKKVKAPLTQAMDEFMWWVGYRVHYLTYEAMEWAGILVEHETPLLTGEWRGTPDAFFTPDYREPRIMGYECKTTRPKGFNHAHTLPKEQHLLQVGAYGLHRPLEWVIEYVFFGSSKPPVECVVKAGEYADAAKERMALIEAAVAAGDAPLLPEAMVPHYRKRRNAEVKDFVGVTLECSWQCSYCSYCHTYPPKNEREKYPPLRAGSPCKPPWHEPLTLAKFTQKGGWEFPSDHPGLDAFIKAQEKTVPIIGGQEQDE